MASNLDRSASPQAAARADRCARLAAALILSLTFAAAGCGSGGKKETVADNESAVPEKHPPTQRTAPSASAGGEQKPANTPTAAPAPNTASKAAEPAATGGGGTVVLTDRGCVEFQPHWATIRVGQSLTWRSQLKKPITIHVTAGTFDREEFVVPARGTVRTGPAREAGDHSIWSLPGACQAAPHGVQGAGPGVSVEPAS